ncbi:hypothetical protein RB597_008511 [Gaeumannomyces tritici]
MAISDRIPGLEVTVKVDGERATEHHDDAAYDEPCAVKLDSPDGVRVVKYIEATSGAPFSVHIKRTSGFNFRGNHIGWSVAVDGGQLCKKQEFGDLDIVSADTHITAEMMAKQMLLAKSLGVITVGVYHLLRPNRVKPWRAKPHDDINTGPINEKALKGRALSLKTTADAEPGVRPARRDIYNYRFMDPEQRPFAVFEFRYRTKGDLIKEAILRAPPSPAENDNQKEKKHAAGIKREAGEASQAPPSRRIKQSRRPDGKFLVDLTDD